MKEPSEQFRKSRTFTNVIEPLLPKIGIEQPCHIRQQNGGKFEDNYKGQHL